MIQTDLKRTKWIHSIEISPRRTNDRSNSYGSPDDLRILKFQEIGCLLCGSVKSIKERSTWWWWNNRVINSGQWQRLIFYFQVYTDIHYFFLMDRKLENVYERIAWHGIIVGCDSTQILQAMYGLWPIKIWKDRLQSLFVLRFIHHIRIICMARVYLYRLYSHNKSV